MAFTSSQKKAVQTTGTNLLVSAGAGTGKTRVLVERVLYLLRTQKARLTELLILTFTEKAANEIKERLSAGLRELGLERARRDLEKAAISTFHGFASRLLKEHPVEAGVDPDFRVIEAEQSELLKEEAMRETIVRCHAEEDSAFEFFSAYGEGAAQDGILKVFTAARHEGKTLRIFFEESAGNEKEISGKRERTLPDEARELCAKLGEVDLPAWERFLANRSWGLETFADFVAWSALYKGKRKAGWKEWRTVLADLAALRLTPLLAPWKEKFEKLALAFEAAYSAKKREKGFLDFDDLQMKAVELFRSERPELRKLRERYQSEFKFILIDEFQDTNTVQTEFVELLSKDDNLFMVGDYKQSIYGFRGAAPEIFHAKDALYGKGSGGMRIFLSESFRSDPPLLDFVNRFFKTLWDEDHFPFEPLVAGHTDDGKNAGQGPSVEVLVTDLREDEDIRGARTREAGAMAARIREVHEKEKVPYGDIAVLFQAMTASGVYEDTFKSAGIPYFVVAGRGFYEQPEIQDVVSFLAHLEHPLADIPLAATLRSPLFHITDDTLFWLSRYAKAKDRDAPLGDALKMLDRIPEIAREQKIRLGSFLALIRRLREIKDRVPLSELIDQMLAGTGYELSVLADPKGVRRYANLKKLMAMTREYESYERMPVTSFLNILKRLKAREVRESEAQVALESGAEAVRMMSVHAAKGLEFPVVFVADMGRQGSRADSKTVIAHAANGYALQMCGGDDEIRRSYFFTHVDDAISRREDEEWKRLLYVAVTRAKSRLFLSGVHKKKKEEKKTFREMSSWMDWVMTICGEGFGGVKVLRDTETGKTFRRPGPGDLDVRVEAFAKDLELKEKNFKKIKPAVPAITLSRTIDLPVSAYVLFQKDPAEFWRAYQIGWSVGENEWAGEETIFRGEDFSVADFGTAMHGFLEHWDLQDAAGALETGTLERVFGRFGAKAVSEAQKILQDFLGQPVFQALQKARTVHREIDFVLNERRGLIHGKIDVLFEDMKGEWHILDYKTAAGDEASTRKNAYDLQLEIYAVAAKRILKVPVRSAVIYYLRNQKAVTLPFQPEKAEAVFDDLEKKMRAAQQRILDYSNERMSEACEVEP